MTEFNVKKDDYGSTFFSYGVLPSGQTIKIEFEEDETEAICYYNIYLVIMDKRKSEHKTVLHSMGKDGLLGLVWAKQKIIEFEEFIKDKIKDKTIVILCRWDDNRRRDVYYRGLKSIGYRYDFIFGSKAISKKIKQSR